MTEPKSTAREKRAESRVRRARVALARLTPDERATLFREVGQCACHTLVRSAAKSPGMVVGALFGAVVGAALSIPEKK